MKRRRAIVVTCLTAVVFTAGLILLPPQVVDLYQPSNQVFRPISTSTAQTLVVRADRFSSIGFFFDFTDKFRGPKVVQVQIADDATGRVLRTATRQVDGAGLNIPGNNTSRPTYFDFAPLRNWEGLRIRATLTVVQGDRDQGIGVWGGLDDTYPDGTAYLDGVVQPYDLSFVTRHDGTIGQRLGRLSHWAPGWIVILAALGMAMLAACTALAGSDWAAGPPLARLDVK